MSETIKNFDPVTPGFDCDPFVQLQRIFVYFLQSLFEHDVFRGSGLWWNKDETVAEMLVTSEKPRVESLSKTPHITVIVGSSQWSGVGLDQMQSRKIAQEERTHTDLVSGTVAFHCQGRDGNFCRRAGWYVSYYINIFRRFIMRHGGIFNVGVRHAITAESGPTAYTGNLAAEELVSVVTTVPIFWQPQWFIREPRDLLKNAQMSLNVRGHKVNPLKVGGRLVNTIAINQYNNFQEVKDAANPPPQYTQQVVVDSEE